MKILKRILSGKHESANRPDKPLIFITGILVIFGMVMLASASSIVAYNEFHDSYYLFKHQLIGLTLGVLAFYFFSKIDYHYWKKNAFLMLFCSIVLLLLVFIPGLKAKWGTAHSWINVFGFSLQPSEFVKITFLLYLAAWLESRKNKLADVAQGIIPFFGVLGLIAVLMLLQPDFGTLSIIALASLVVYFVGGCDVKHLLAVLVIGALAVSLMVLYKPYQANRFKCLMDPNYSKKEFCYQINQSLIAIGSGGIFGRGIGESRQKFLYLPEVSGDAIFPVIGEEIGFIFSTALIMLYLLFFYRGYLIAKYASDDFGRILAIGIVSWIVFQAMINIGGMSNILPMTGVPLPFVSYGGSSILTVLAATGILVNISRQAHIA